MTGKILLLMLIAAGMLAAQDTSPKPAESETKVEDVAVTAPARTCSIPLINIRPATTSRMPLIRPHTEFVSKRFFIEPPAPPCEDLQPNPLISRGAEKKDPPPAK